MLVYMWDKLTEQLLFGWKHKLNWIEIEIEIKIKTKMRLQNHNESIVHVLYVLSTTGY